jgi:hypothetical protein
VDDLEDPPTAVSARSGGGSAIGWVNAPIAALPPPPRLATRGERLDRPHPGDRRLRGDEVEERAQRRGGLARGRVLSVRGLREPPGEARRRAS